MPMKMPFGPPWLRDMEWKMPNLVMAAVPGFERLATTLMRETLRQKGVAPVEELRDICVETEVRLMACQMTVDLFGWKKEDFIEGISEWAGAATFLTVARDADVCLYTWPALIRTIAVPNILDSATRLVSRKWGHPS
jgi:peroxiredoxin family protein